MVLKRLNKAKLVDEYQVTFWTRGQYPAAPPRMFFKPPVWAVFYVGSIVLRGEYRENKAKNKSATCEEWPISWSFAVIFVFGPWITFLLRNYPYNMTPSCLCQHVFKRFFG